MKFSFIFFAFICFNLHGQTVIRSKYDFVKNPCNCNVSNASVKDSLLHYDHWFDNNGTVETFSKQDGTDFFVIDYNTSTVITFSGTFHAKIVTIPGSTDEIVYFGGWKIVIRFNLHNGYDGHTKKRLF